MCIFRLSRFQVQRPGHLVLSLKNELNLTHHPGQNMQYVYFYLGREHKNDFKREGFWLTDFQHWNCLVLGQFPSPLFKVFQRLELLSMAFVQLQRRVFELSQMTSASVAEGPRRHIMRHCGLFHRFRLPHRRVTYQARIYIIIVRNPGHEHPARINIIYYCYHCCVLKVIPV